MIFGIFVKLLELNQNLIMKRTLLSCLALAMVFSAKSQILIEDNFDSYTAGMGVAEQSTSWDTWDGSAGLDGEVSTDYSNSGE